MNTHLSSDLNHTRVIVSGKAASPKPSAHVEGKLVPGRRFVAFTLTNPQEAAKTWHPLRALTSAATPSASTRRNDIPKVRKHSRAVLIVETPHSYCSGLYEDVRYLLPTAVLAYLHLPVSPVSLAKQQHEAA